MHQKYLFLYTLKLSQLLRLKSFLRKQTKYAKLSQ
jgi:hypothetical protein